MTGQYRYKASPPTRWKLSCIVRPRKRKYQHGSCQSSAGTRPVSKTCTYLGKLSPVQKVTGIIFKDKNKVDLVFMPYAAGKGEQDDQQVDKEEAGVNLFPLALHTLQMTARLPVASS